MMDYSSKRALLSVPQQQQDATAKYIVGGSVLAAAAYLCVMSVAPTASQQALYTTATTTPAVSTVSAVQNARRPAPTVRAMQRPDTAYYTTGTMSAPVQLRAPASTPQFVEAPAQDRSVFWMWATACSLIANAAFFMFRRSETRMAMAATAGEPKTEIVEDDEEEEAEEEKELTPMEALEKELEETKAKLAEAEKQVMYSLAEVETMRRRTKTQVEDAKQFGAEKLAKSILEVADNMQRGLAWVSKDVTEGPAGDENPNPDLRSLWGGMKSTEKIMLNILERNGITKYEPKGEQFDAEMCRAIMQVPDPNNEPGTIVEVAVAGYLLNGRVLRAADVIVVQDEE